MDTIDISATDAFYEKKKNPGSTRPYTNFRNDSKTPEGLTQEVTSGGTICVAAVKNNHRKKSNFISSQLIGIDVDSGSIRSVEALLEVPFIAKYAFFVGPTASSIPTSPRSRIFFKLDEAITDPKQYEDYVLRVMYALQKAGVDVDTSCKDAVRMFHGSTQQGYHTNFDNVLPVDVIESLPAPHKHRSKKLTVISKKGSKQNKKKQSPKPILNPEQLSQLEQKIRSALSYLHQRYDDYNIWLKILMAVWDAFPNELGVQLIEEWSPGYPGEVAEKFASFSKDVPDPVTINTLWYFARQNGWSEGTTVAPDILINKQYISEAMDKLAKLMGAVLIRSDMATGKSTYVDLFIQRMEQQLNRSLRVLIISHRKALTNNLSRRFNFESYASLENHQMRQPDKLVITPNSLHKLGDMERGLPTYDVVVIDEIEQVLMHLVGETFNGNTGVVANNIMKYLIEKSTLTLGLDAHAGQLAYDYFKSIRDDVHYVVNTHIAERGNMTIMESKTALYTEIIQTVQTATHPVIIACDEKARVEELEEFLHQHGVRRVMAIHSDNSSSPIVQDFLKDIDDKLPEYEVLLYSPSIGTGVDIQAEVEVVFGIFGGKSITAEEQHQMLVRCRKARQFYVFTHWPKSKKPTNQNDIYNQHYRRIISTGWLCDFDPEGQPRITESQRHYLHLVSYVEAQRNRAMNNGMRDFMHLAHRNFKVDHWEGEGDKAYEEHLKQIRERLKAEEEHRILTCSPIDPDAYKQAEFNNEVTEEIEAGHIRWQIEDTFGQGITQDLLKKWSNGKFKAKLLQFIDLHKTIGEIIGMDNREEAENVAWAKRHHYMKRWRLFEDMRRIFFGQNFHCETIPLDELNQSLYGLFDDKGDYNNRDTLYKILKRQEPKEETPLKVLRYLLKRIGLKFNQVRRGRDKVPVGYAIDAHSYNDMLAYAQSYTDRKGIQVNLPSPMTE